MPSPKSSEMRPGTLVEDQQEVIAFLADPATHGGAAVEEIETHGARVFLVGDRVYKLKRAVWYPFMDFSTLAKRRVACQAELRLNRRTAPSIYLDACPVVRTADAALAIGGAGEELDWVVVMARFDQDVLLDRVAQRGALDTETVERLADAVAQFHEQAERMTAVDFVATMTDVIAGNRESLEAWFSEPSAREDISALDRMSRAALDQCRTLMDQRSSEGFVRWCHGDLHLRNLCLVDGRPTLFDCIEFNESLAIIDVFYDLAFLLMDMEHRGLRAFANIVLNRYIARTGDFGALRALPLFLSVRAAIRAHVTAAAAATMDADMPDQNSAAMFAEAANYLALAGKLLEAPQPALVAVGGLSGSGKSTLARELAPSLGGALGGVVVRSDVVRKNLAGVDFFDRLPVDAYSMDRNRAVYERLYELSGIGLAAGRCVVADAVFRNDAERAEIARIAADYGVPFVGLWLDISPAAQEQRLATRWNDVSDATVEVGRAQRANTGSITDWTHLNADQDLPQLTAASIALLKQRGLAVDRSD